MNEQLKKAIEEATKVFPWPVPISMGGGDVLDINVHKASQAKLLRVIELLVRQRDDWISTNILADPIVQDEEATIENYVKADNAELIAALEKKND